jgi:AcrR family transcriptional regulator
MSKDDVVKAEILDSAANLFQKWGYNKTTIEDIAKSAGKGKSSLYYYYKDKEEIFSAVITREVNSVFTVISENMNKHKLAADKLRAYLSTYFSEIEKSRNVYNIVVGEMFGNVHILMRLGKGFDDMQAATIKKIIELGLKQKEFSFPKNIDPASVSYMITSAIGGIMVDLMLFDQKQVKLDISEVMSWIVLDGMKKRTES